MYTPALYKIKKGMDTWAACKPFLRLMQTGLALVSEMQGWPPLLKTTTFHCQREQWAERLRNLYRRHLFSTECWLAISSHLDKVQDKSMSLKSISVPLREKLLHIEKTIHRFTLVLKLSIKLMKLQIQET